MIIGLRTRGGASHLCQFVGFRVYSWIRAIHAGSVSVKRRLTCVLGCDRRSTCFSHLPGSRHTFVRFRDFLHWHCNATFSNHNPVLVPPRSFVSIGSSNMGIPKISPVVFTPKILTIQISCVPDWQSYCYCYERFAVNDECGTLENTYASAAQF